MSHETTAIYHARADTRSTKQNDHGMDCLRYILQPTIPARALIPEDATRYAVWGCVRIDVTTQYDYTLLPDTESLHAAKWQATRAFYACEQVQAWFTEHQQIPDLNRWRQGLSHPALHSRYSESVTLHAQESDTEGPAVYEECFFDDILPDPVTYLYLSLVWQAA